jgi:hypothetical protein
MHIRKMAYGERIKPFPFPTENRIIMTADTNDARGVPARWPWARRMGHKDTGGPMSTEIQNVTPSHPVDCALVASNGSLASRDVASACQSNAELFPFSADGRQEFTIARRLSTLSATELKERGWAHALSSGPFNVYTQADPTDSSLLRFLVIGRIDDASPRSSMYSFINGDCRVKWDTVSIRP